jgi:hypothetical protein
VENHTDNEKNVATETSISVRLRDLALSMRIGRAYQSVGLAGANIGDG